MAKCMRCKGAGKVFCRECAGSGTLPYYLFHLEYGESSEVLHNRDQIDCKECHGIGKSICKECHGSGYITSD